MFNWVVLDGCYGSLCDLMFCMYVYIFILLFPLIFILLGDSLVSDVCFCVSEYLG